MVGGFATPPLRLAINKRSLVAVCLDRCALPGSWLPETAEALMVEWHFGHPSATRWHEVHGGTLCRSVFVDQAEHGGPSRRCGG